MANRNMIISLLSLFTIFFYTAIEIPTLSFATSNETDLQALLDFKNHIQSDPSQFLSSWNDSIHFCNWQGITCGKRHERVTVLNVSSLDLVGTLSPSIDQDRQQAERVFPRTQIGEITERYERRYTRSNKSKYVWRNRSLFEEQTQRSYALAGSHTFKFVKELPTFDGSSPTLDLFDWGDAIEEYFGEMNTPEALKCEIAACRLKGTARLWWKGLQDDRFMAGKNPISSWSRMRKLLIARFEHRDCSMKCPLETYSSSFEENNVCKMSEGLYHTTESSWTEASNKDNGCSEEKNEEAITIKHSEQEGADMIKYLLADKSTSAKCSIELLFESGNGKQQGISELEVHDTYLDNYAMGSDDTTKRSTLPQSNTDAMICDIQQGNGLQQLGFLVGYDDGGRVKHAFGEGKSPEMVEGLGEEHLIIQLPKIEDHPLNEHLETEMVAYSVATSNINGGSDYEAVELKLKQKMTFEIGAALLPQMSKRSENVLDNHNFKVPRVVWKNVKLEEMKWLIRSILTTLILDEYMVSKCSVAEIAFLIFDPGGVLYKTRSTTFRLGISAETIAFRVVPNLQRKWDWRFDILRTKAASRSIFLLCPCVIIWPYDFVDKAKWLGWSLKVDVMLILSLIIWSNNTNGESLLSKMEHRLVASFMTTFNVGVGGMVFNWNVKPIGAKVLEFILDFGKPCAHFTTTIVACVTKKIHVKEANTVHLKKAPTEVISTINDGVKNPINVEAEHEVTMYLTSQKSEALRSQLKPSLLSVGFDTAIPEMSSEEAYIIQLKLSNEMAVDYGLLRNGEKSWVMTIIANGGRVAENSKSKETINVVVCTWNKGRGVVQVEIIFMDNLENCSLESAEALIYVVYTLRGNGMQVIVQLPHLVSVLDTRLCPMAWLKQLIRPPDAIGVTAMGINYALDEHFRAVWLIKLFNGVFVQRCNLQMDTGSNLTRGRVISWVGWNDENNANMKRKFIMVEIIVGTFNSCLSISCANGYFKRILRLFFKLVNGLDPPIDIDGSLCGISMWTPTTSLVDEFFFV